MNTLEHEPINTNKSMNSMKNKVRAFLEELFVSHFSITSLSANCYMALHIGQKQMGNIKLLMIGGISEVRLPFTFINTSPLKSRSQEETTKWWYHYEPMLPTFKDKTDKMKVLDMTGCIPLFLQPLLGFGYSDFHYMEKRFWAHSDFSQVRTNIYQLANKIKKSGEFEYWT